MAADSQRVSSAGESEAPYDKTFAVGHTLIGAYAGLLEFAGKDVKTHIFDALRGANMPAADAAELISRHMQPILEGIADSDVAHSYRRLDVIVASRNDVVSAAFFPGTDGHSIRVDRAANKLWLVGGAERPHAVAHKRLSQQDNIPALRLRMLRHVAESAAQAAIAAGGPHEYHPRQTCCCLPVRLLSIPPSVA